jgi:hypothetical protein
MLGAFIGWGIYYLYILTDNKILSKKAFYSTAPPSSGKSG